MYIVVQYRTKHAGGITSWQPRWLWLADQTEGAYQKALKSLVEKIDQSFDWSDKYRGVEVERVPEDKLPVEWLGHQVEHFRGQAEEATRRVRRCKDLLRGMGVKITG